MPIGIPYYTFMLAKTTNLVDIFFYLRFWPADCGKIYFNNALTAINPSQIYTQTGGIQTETCEQVIYTLAEDADPAHAHTQVLFFFFCFWFNASIAAASSRAAAGGYWAMASIHFIVNFVPNHCYLIYSIVFRFDRTAHTQTNTDHTTVAAAAAAALISSGKSSSNF